MGLAVGAEPGEARDPGGAARGPGPAARWRPTRAARRSWRSARSVKVVRPGHAAAVGKQRATTDASRSMTSTSAPPMYEATELMPMRARVLRRPASKAVDEPLDRLGRRDRLGAARPRQLGRELDGQARMDRRRADGQQHRHRVDVEDVRGIDDEVGARRAGRPRSARRGPRRRPGSTGPGVDRDRTRRRTAGGPRHPPRTGRRPSRPAARGPPPGRRARRSRPR